MLETVERISSFTATPLAAQPNAGRPRDVEGRNLYLTSPEYMASYARRFIASGVRLVGGCCGTTPEHIRQIKAAVIRAAATAAKSSSVTAPAAVAERSVATVPLGERSKLAAALAAGRFVRIVELRPPRGYVSDTLIEQARALERAGIDAVNISEGARGGARMSALALAVLVQQHTAMETVLQYSCRDRNLLGMQSDLLGAHLLGIRNILCLTGDYPTVGDHKDAKPVYDLDSVQVMQLVKGFNEGRDLAGNKLDGVTEYMIGAAVTPEMDPQGPMLAKFEAKVKAGASFFQTQAIYDAAHFANFMKQIRPFKARVLAGILLLRSAKMAEFLNANIPGISVPAETIAELRAAGPKHEQEVGIEIAVRTIKAVRSHCDGVHLMVLKATDKLPDLLTKAQLG